MLSTFILLTFYYLTICVLTFYPVDFLSFWLFSYLLLSVWLFAAWLFVRRLFSISTFYLLDLLPFDFQRRRLFTRWFYVRWLSVRLPFTFRLFTLEPFEHPRLSRLLRIVEQNGKRRSKVREKSFRNHIGHVFAQVKIEVNRGQNFKIFQNGFWTIKSLILKVEQRFLYHRVCLVKARRTMFDLTLKDQGQNLTSGQVRARSLGDPSRSNYTLFDAPCGDKRNDTNPASLSHLDLKLLAKNCWWPRVTSMTFRGFTD